MKNSLFTIGELSKLYNIPIKTLRYYDEIGLLKPAKVDADSNYRYYTVEQFILIDLIKNSKIMGMSLAEIKELASGELTVERIEHSVSEQIEQYEKKIIEMTQIQNSMKQYLKIISQSRDYEMGKIFIQYEQERYCMVYPYKSVDVTETEFHLRKAFLEAGNIKNEVYPIFGAACSSERYMREGIIEYSDIREYLDQASDEENYIVIPKGRYLSIYFDEPAKMKDKYYNQMKDYIEENQLTVSGDFNETWLIPRLNRERQESTLLRLDIMLV